MLYEKEICNIVDTIFGDFDILSNHNIPKMPSTILLEKDEKVIKLKFYSNTVLGKNKAESDFKYLSYIASYNRPYISKIYDAALYGQCLITITKKYKEIDSLQPIFTNYTAEYLINNNLILKFMDTIYDMWLNKFYIEDRLPSRNLCLDEWNNIIHIDFDINMEKYDSINSNSFDKFRFFETLWESERIKIENFYKERFNKTITEYYNGYKSPF